jgi:hypothetical protein
MSILKPPRPAPHYHKNYLAPKLFLDLLSNVWGLICSYSKRLFDGDERHWIEEWGKISCGDVHMWLSYLRLWGEHVWGRIAVGARDTTLAQATRATLFDFSVEEEWLGSVLWLLSDWNEASFWPYSTPDLAIYDR